MKKVGITGGIGSGKSTVAKVFEVLRIPVYYADQQAKYLMNNHPKLQEQIITEFGPESYSEHGLNKEYLASIIFTDQDKAKLINRLVHPVVRADFTDWIKQQNAPYVVQEAALLVDNGSYQFLDALITVYASIESRVKRTLKRDPFRTKEQVYQIIGQQFSEEKRQSVANYVIQNEKDLIIPQVLEIHKALITS